MDIQEILATIPVEASEAVVSSLLFPSLLQALGFEDHREHYPQYPTGQGGDVVDYAARKNLEDSDIFLETRQEPFLLVELKGRDINLEAGSRYYSSAKRQLIRYLLAPRCKTAKWGIITNSHHIQLFRKHGKVIFPATECIQLNNAAIAKIRSKLENTPKALIVAVYNNKGGVGKTTTTVNLAAFLSLFGKKVLVIDFDPNQQDLTSSIGKHPIDGGIVETLKSKTPDLRPFISHFQIQKKIKGELRKFGFDIIAADSAFLNSTEERLMQEIEIHRLQDGLSLLSSDYDYILIDSSPNWRFFSRSALCAADVVLIPTKHNNIFSLENAAIAIKNFIPEIQARRQDGGPVALPIFFNGEKISIAQEKAAQEAIHKIIERAKKEDKFNLLPYFYPKYTASKKDLQIFSLPSYANISGAIFNRIPAAYKDKTAFTYYKDLAMEYFLQ